MDLQPISDFCGQLNRPGLLRLEYISTAWINLNTYERLISSSWNWQYDIPLTTGQWLDFPILPREDLWNEVQSNSKQGPVYEQTISAITPRLRAEVTGAFQKMANHDFLLRLTDKQGQKWLIGQLNAPFRFRCNGTTGSGGSGLNHYAIRFFCQTSQRATGFNPVL